MFLQNYVVPIVRIEETKDGSVVINELLGSAFHIGTKGICISASHVLKPFLNDLDDICILTGPPSSYDKVEQACQISKISFAPNNSDICIFLVQNVVQHPFKIANVAPMVWQDIATYGYPQNITVPISKSWWINSRHLKGYIQKVNETGKFGYDDVSNFEVSFSISKGLSGAPLFIHSGSNDEVIGVCVGTNRTEIGNEIEEFGIAENLINLKEWKPDGYNGLSLHELTEI